MRGQVTLFVIIGLAILIVAGLFVLVQRDDRPSLAESQDAARISAFTQSCLAVTGEAVLREMGTTGGYYDLSKLKATGNPRDSQVVSVGPQDIAMWHEVHPCQENVLGCLSDNRPSLCEEGARCPVPYAAGAPTSIQEELERGIEERIDSCLDFSAFPDLIIEKEGAPEVTATIREENIALALDYPMTITAGDAETSIDAFSATLDIALPDLYRFAARIQEAQRDNAFLENVFLQFLTVYSGADAALPPFREVSFLGAPHYWVRTQVQELLEQDVLPFMNFIQIINAEESFAPVLAPQIEEKYRPYAEGLYQYLVVKVDEEAYPYAAQIEYPYTPIFLDINGKELLRPQQFGGGGFLAKFTGMMLTQYKFRYTAAFPVVVHVSDPAAFNGEGYQLDFGLEANIRNNRPLNTSAPAVELVSTYTTLDLSDPQQLVNHTYELKVHDLSDPERPLSGVMINYECGMRYYMGETDSDGIWRGKLPYCFAGGALMVQRDGYLGTGIELSNAADDGASSVQQVGMWPYREKTVKVYKITEEDVQEILTGVSRTDARSQLGVNDSIVLEIARAGTPYDDEAPLGGILQFGKQGRGAVQQLAVDSLHNDLRAAYEAGAFAYEGGEEQYREAVASLQEIDRSQEAANISFNVTRQVALVPGTYRLQGSLIYTGLIQIPEEKRCEEILGVCAKEYTLPAQNYSSWVSGGVVLDGSSAFVIEPEDLYSDQDITLYVLEQPIPVDWKGMERQKPFEEYQSTYGRQMYVRPEMS